MRFTTTKNVLIKILLEKNDELNPNLEKLGEYFLSSIKRLIEYIFSFFSSLKTNYFASSEENMLEEDTKLSYCDDEASNYSDS